MKVIAVVEHKHGKGHYMPGEEYDLEPKDAYYLLGLGWMKEPGKEGNEPKSGDASLDIQNSTIGVGDNNG